MLNRGRNIEKGRVITRRMFILAAAKILLFAGISSRLYNLQISDREKYEILSDKNRTNPKNKVVHAIPNKAFGLVSAPQKSKNTPANSMPNIYIITIYSTFVILFLIDPLYFLLSVSTLTDKAPYPDKTDKTPKVPDSYVSKPIVLSY